MTDENRFPGALGSIALSLSGGGARAVGFHLGTMSYLDHLGVLQDVSILSTISGGTFIGAKYALCLKTSPDEDPHVTFGKFYDELSNYIVKADLLSKTLTELATKPETRAEQRTVITALANVYDRDLTGGAKFGVFWEDRDIHLKDIMFSASEFENGLAFRFQRTEQESRIGNGKVWIDSAEARLIRLADIVAASSDLPVAFEPMRFPQDFVFEGNPPRLEQADESPNAERIDSLTLMDGGILDNQGIDSVLLAFRRRDWLEDFDDQVRMEPPQATDRISELGMFIISDVAHAPDDLYDAPAHAPSGWIASLPLSTAIAACWFLLVMSVATAVVSLVHFLVSNPPLVEAPFYLFSIGLSAMVAGLFVWVRHQFRKVARAVEDNAGPVDSHITDTLKALPLRDVMYMVRSRVGSTVAMASDIFMARIRRLGYSFVYSQDWLNERLLPVEIYDLLHNPRNQPSPALRAVIARACKMGTKFQMTAGELEDLILAGQATTCHNILNALEEWNRPVPDGLYEQVRKDWLRFQDDPRSLSRDSQTRSEGSQKHFVAGAGDR